MSSTLYQLSYSLFGGEGDNRGASYQTHLIKEMTASAFGAKPAFLRRRLALLRRSQPPTRITLLAAPPAFYEVRQEAGSQPARMRNVTKSNIATIPHVD